MTTQLNYQMQAVQQDSSTFLRNVLKSNGAFSLVSGLAFVAAANPIATFLGLQQPVVLTVIGIILLAFAADLFFLATRKQLDQRFVIAVIGADALWVVGSVVLLLTNLVPLTVGGKWAVAIVAIIVGAFADLQFYGLRKLTRNK